MGIDATRKSEMTPSSGVVRVTTANQPGCSLHSVDSPHEQQWLAANLIISYHCSDFDLLLMTPTD